MSGRLVDARRRRRAAVWIGAALLCGRASAQYDGDLPKFVGFPAGPFMIAPSLTTGYAYNSNVFLNTADLSPEPDQVLTLQPALQVTLPFSNNTLRVADTLSWIDYKETPQVSGKTSNDAYAALDLRLGSQDEIELTARHINGVAETLAFDPGGEVTFEGNAYRYHTESATFSREVAGARGYRFNLERNALRFDRSDAVYFFDYKGFEGEAAYLQPLSPNTHLAFGYRGTRYDHYDVSPGSDPNKVFRTEDGHVVYAEVEGRLGPKQPYSFRLGWELLNFDGNAAKDFSGIIGDARLSAIVGGGTIFTIEGQRHPFRSFFPEDTGDPDSIQNNYYVYEQVGARVERPFPRGSRVGGGIALSRNAYDEPVDGILRKDRAVMLEAYGNLAVGDRVILRLSVLKNRKYSNYPGADYDALVVFGGFVVGWL